MYRYSAAPDPSAAHPLRSAAARRRRSIVRAARAELAQLRTLMGNATGLLTTSFEALAGKVATSSTVEDRRLVRGSIDTERTEMDRAVADAVTAMQFHDIASQLLISVDIHLGRLDETIEQATSAAGDAVLPVEHGAARSPTSVTQTTMTAGTVELF